MRDTEHGFKTLWREWDMLILTGWNRQRDSLIDGTMKNNHASLIDALGSLK